MTYSCELPRCSTKPKCRRTDSKAGPLASSFGYGLCMIRFSYSRHQLASRCDNLLHGVRFARRVPAEQHSRRPGARMGTTLNAATRTAHRFNHRVLLRISSAWIKRWRSWTVRLTRLITDLSGSPLTAARRARPLFPAAGRSHSWACAAEGNAAGGTRIGGLETASRGAAPGSGQRMWVLGRGGKGRREGAPAPPSGSGRVPPPPPPLRTAGLCRSPEGWRGAASQPPSRSPSFSSPEEARRLRPAVRCPPGCGWQRYVPPAPLPSRHVPLRPGAAATHCLTRCWRAAKRVPASAFYSVVSRGVPAWWGFVRAALLWCASSAAAVSALIAPIGGMRLLRSSWQNW